MNTYGKDGSRLINDVLVKGNVAGFVVNNFDGQETLYAVFASGKSYSRKAATPNSHFNRSNAKWIESKVPDGAEWIGQYPEPKQIKQ